MYGRWLVVSPDHVVGAKQVGQIQKSKNPPKRALVRAALCASHGARLGLFTLTR